VRGIGVVVSLWIATSCSSPATSSTVTPRPSPTAPAAVDAAPPDADPGERTVVWANIVPTPGCFYFAGPFDFGTQDSYRDRARLRRDSQSLEIRFGDAVFEGEESIEVGYLFQRRAEYLHDNEGSYTTMEIIAGDFDRRQAFRGSYQYEECKVGETECPGRCALTADLIVQ
jgi:hypothetical protein